MNKSETYFQEALTRMPGGVNSPVRAFGAVGGTPRYITDGSGAMVVDADGNRYIDYVCSWGPLILGHAHPRVIAAVTTAAQRGLGFGACHPAEIELTGKIQQHMPHIERMRLVNSGTEATMSAVRLARAATGRDTIIKCIGCYHGHADSFLIAAGSGALTHGNPSSPGVTAGAARDTRLAIYNDLSSVEACFAAGPVAAIIVEPVAGNMGMIPPTEGFLQGLRALCDQYNALLIFDEVITGFRLGLGGAAAHFGITPDLTALGKIIGGGLPVGAYGGRADLMEQMSPTGPVYQAGTLSGNPVACAAGIATLTVLEEENPYPRMAQLNAQLAQGLLAQAKAAGLRVCGNHLGSLSTLFFGCDAAGCFADVKDADTALYGRYHQAMLDQGVYLAPSQFETGFVSAAHTEEDIARTLQAQEKALAHCQS